MAEYIYINEKNVQGKNTTFNPTNKLPIIGSRIWATLADLDAYLNDQTSSAIAGIHVAVIADPTPGNNGSYQIIFKDSSLIENYYGIKGGKAMTPTVTFATEIEAQDAVTAGTIDSYRANISMFYEEDGVTKCNLTYKKLINIDEQGCVTGGSVVDGFKATISGVERFVYQRVNSQTGEYEYYYFDDQGQEQPYTHTTETVHTYLALNLTDGEIIFVNADELKGVSDTYVNYGEILQHQDGNIYIDLWRNTHVPHSDTPDVSILLNKSSVTYNTSTDTLTATTGLFNNEAMQVIEQYIDNFDCGTY